MDFFFLHEYLMQHIIRYSKWMARSGIKTWAFLAFVLMLILPDTLGRFARAPGAGGWTLQPARGAAALLEARRLVLCGARRQGWGSHSQKLAPATSLAGSARFWCCTVETKVVILMFPPFIFWLSLSASLSVAVGAPGKQNLSFCNEINHGQGSYPFLALLHLQVVSSLGSEKKSHWWQVATLISKGTAALSGVSRFEMYIVLPQIPQKKQQRGKHE